MRINSHQRQVILILVALLMPLLSLSLTIAQAQGTTECLNIAYAAWSQDTVYPQPSWWKIYDPRTQAITSDHRINQGIPINSPDGQYAIYFELFPLDPSVSLKSPPEIVVRVIRLADTAVIAEHRYQQEQTPEISWSPDSHWVWIAGNVTPPQLAGTLLDVTTGNENTFEAKSTLSIASSWSANSQYLALFSTNSDERGQKTLFLWSVAQQTTLEIASQVARTEWDPTSSYLGFVGINVTNEPYLGIYSVTNGINAFYPGSENHLELHWSPSGRYLVFGGRVFDQLRGEIGNFTSLPALGTLLETVYFSPDESFIRYATWDSSDTWQLNTQTGELSLALSNFVVHDPSGLLWGRVNNDTTVSILMPDGTGWIALVENLRVSFDVAYQVATPFVAPNAVEIRYSFGTSRVYLHVAPDERFVAVIWAEQATLNSVRWHIAWAAADEGFRQVRTLTLHESFDLSTYPTPTWFTQGDFLLLNHPQGAGYRAAILNLRSGEQVTTYENMALTIPLTVDSAQDGAALWWLDKNGNSAVDVFSAAGERVAQLPPSTLLPNITWNSTGNVLRSAQGQLAVYWQGLIGLNNSIWAIQLFDATGNAQPYISFPNAELSPRAVKWITCP